MNKRVPVRLTEPVPETFTDLVQVGAQGDSNSFC